jgi:hypothetical protein
MDETVDIHHLCRPAVTGLANVEEAKVCQSPYKVSLRVGRVEEASGLR